MVITDRLSMEMDESEIQTHTRTSSTLKVRRSHTQTQPGFPPSQKCTLANLAFQGLLSFKSCSSGAF